MTLQEVEHALSHGYLWMRLNSGKYWVCRRNGATKRWKRHPSDWEIPVKAGLKICARVAHTSGIGVMFGDEYIISPVKPDGVVGRFEGEMRRASC